MSCLPPVASCQEITTGLAPCPVCKSKAFVSRDAFDGFFFGYSVGCPKACIDDPVHKLGEEELKKARLVMFGFTTKEEAVEAWNRRATERSEENE